MLLKSRRGIRRIVVLTGLVAGALWLQLAPAAWADGATWSGSGDGHTWTDANNWVGGQVPQPGDSVSIAPTKQTPLPNVSDVPAISLQNLSFYGAGLSGGAVTVTQSFSWEAGNIAVPLTMEGSGSATGTGTHELTGGAMTVSRDATFTVSPATTISAPSCCVNPYKFKNSGTLIVPPSSGDTATFTNFEVDDSGPIAVGRGSTLDLLGDATGTLAAGVSVDGGGTLRLDNGTPMSLTGQLSIGAGTSVQLGTTGETYGPALQGAPSFVGKGSLLWEGGSIDGKLDVASTITTTITGSDIKTLLGDASDHQGTLNLAGTTTISGSGPIQFRGDGMLNNTGALHLSPGTTVEALSCCVSPARLTNSGTLTVPASTAGTATLTNLEFDDSGAISVSDGSTLDLLGDAAGKLATGVAVGGGGSLLLANGTPMSLSGSLSVGAGTTLQLGQTGETYGPSIAGVGSLAGSGRFSWQGGVITGKLAVMSTVATMISGSDAKTLEGSGSGTGALSLAGPTWLSGSGQLQYRYYGTLTNSGTFRMSPGTSIVSINAAATFHNAGALVVSAAGGTATLSYVGLANSGRVTVTGGTLAVDAVGYTQTSGVTQLAGGSLGSDKPILISGGVLEGYGLISGAVVNGATVRPGVTGGILEIDGPYQQTAGGTLAAVIGGTQPGNGFGQLKVTEAATLAGRIDVSPAAGYTPPVGHRFSVLAYASHAGQFSDNAGADPYTLTYSAGQADVAFSTPARG